MTTGLMLQHALVGIAVVTSLGFVLQNRFPQAVRAARVGLALRLLRNANPSWIRTLGRRVAPRPMAAAPCGGCNGCEPAKPRAHRV